jgi:predicted Holliday junction resolvase-like endonuclease
MDGLIFLILLVSIVYVVTDVVLVNRRIQEDKMMEELRREKDQRLFRQPTQANTAATGEYLTQQSDPDWEKQREEEEE